MITRSMRRKTGIVILAALSLILYVFIRNNVSDHLIISKVVFSAEDGIDLIEIYNPTLNNLSLKGLYLTDNKNNPTKFRIGKEAVVAGNDYITIYCRGYEDGTENTIVTNFRIAEKETVYLVASNGSTIIDWRMASPKSNGE